MGLEDKLYPFLKIYKDSPSWVKYKIGKFYNILPKKLKYGKFYFVYLNRIKDWRPDHQKKLLEDQLRYASSEIPYYKNLSPSQLKLNNYPIISKNQIKSDISLFIGGDKRKRLKSNTGGSSGTPFEFFLEKNVSRPKEQAHFDWYWGQFNYKEGDPILMVRGEPLTNNKLYEYQPIGNKLLISCYLVNKFNINDLLTVINNFKPKFIHAYPSAIKSLTHLIIASKKQMTLSIQALFLGSEILFIKDRLFLEKYYSAKVINWYGHSERLVHAGNCPYSNEYHVYPFYGFLELLDENNSPVSEPGKKGRIIATGFDNTAMPFIRYDTGDEAILSENYKCKCGFEGITLKTILGRGQDYIFLKDGTKVSLTAFIFGQHFKEFSLINEMQLEQRKKEEILVRIVPNNHFSPKEIKFLQKKLELSVNNKLKVDIIVVDKIEKTSRGKHRFLIQQVK